MLNSQDRKERSLRIEQIFSVVSDRKVLSENGLWFRHGKPFFGGELTDGTPFEIAREILADGMLIVLLVDGKNASEPTAIDDGDENKMSVQLIDTFSEQYWDGVSNPDLWAAAGYTPASARRIIKFPPGHPDRPSEQALQVLYSLSAGSRVNTKPQVKLG